MKSTAPYVLVAVGIAASLVTLPLTASALAPADPQTPAAPASGGQTAPAPEPTLPPPGSSQQVVRAFLGVTDAQQAKVEAIQKKYVDKMQSFQQQLQQLQPDAEKEVEALLTPAQIEKKKAIEAKYRQKFTTLQKQMQNLQEQGNNEIQAVFTPDQQKKLIALQKQEAQLQQMRQQQGQGGGAPAPAAPPK